MGGASPNFFHSSSGTSLLPMVLPSGVFEAGLTRTCRTTTTAPCAGRFNAPRMKQNGKHPLEKTANACSLGLRRHGFCLVATYAVALWLLRALCTACDSWLQSSTDGTGSTRDRSHTERPNQVQEKTVPTRLPEPFPGNPFSIRYGCGRRKTKCSSPRLSSQSAVKHHSWLSPPLAKGFACVPNNCQALSRW